ADIQGKAGGSQKLPLAFLGQTYLELQPQSSTDPLAHRKNQPKKTRLMIILNTKQRPLHF
ncbi:unnamed protein product, partial [marine sediment metagenome]